MQPSHRPDSAAGDALPQRLRRASVDVVICGWASSASPAGFFSPAITASIMARPLTPVTSEIAESSLDVGILQCPLLPLMWLAQLHGSADGCGPGHLVTVRKTDVRWTLEFEHPLSVRGRTDRRRPAAVADGMPPQDPWLTRIAAALFLAKFRDLISAEQLSDQPSDLRTMVRPRADNPQPRRQLLSFGSRLVARCRRSAQKS